jgi:hypothetical protein
LDSELIKIVSRDLSRASRNLESVNTTISENDNSNTSVISLSLIENCNFYSSLWISFCNPLIFFFFFSGRLVVLRELESSNNRKKGFGVLEYR